jgi:hypothetical protein
LDGERLYPVAITRGYDGCVLLSNQHIRRLPELPRRSTKTAVMINICASVSVKSKDYRTESVEYVQTLKTVYIQSLQAIKWRNRTFATPIAATATLPIDGTLPFAVKVINLNTIIALIGNEYG